MNKLSVAFIMLGLGVIFSPRQLLAANLQAEFVSLFTQVNTDNSIIAASGWKEFYSGEGNFSIFVPDTSVTNLNSQNEDYSINIYHADTKKSSYIFGYVDYSNLDSLNLPLSAFYNKFLSEFLGADINLINRQNIRLGKYRGIEVEYKNEIQETFAKSRLFLVGKRLYFLDISNYQAGDYQQFFNSFQLDNIIQENPSKIAFSK